MSGGRAEFFYKKFRSEFPYEPTECQERLFGDIAEFVTCDDADILVVNGYAGTGKTSVISAVIKALSLLGIRSELMAPTGRSAKVLSRMSSRPATTVHKKIYRQKSVGADGLGRFTLAPNKSKSTLFVVDEVSLIGIGASADGAAQVSFGTGNLLEDLVSFLRNGTDCRMIMIGDAAQLPPVGHEVSPALSEEYMKSAFGGVRFSTLTSVVRQASESGILLNATRLRDLIVASSSNGGVVSDEVKLILPREKDDIVRIGGGELIDSLSDAYSRYGEDETIILCRSNKRAIRYNLGVRSRVQFKEESLVRGDKLMIVKNCYCFSQGGEEAENSSEEEGETTPNMDYIANGDVAKLLHIGKYEERYGLNFAEARLLFPDYNDTIVSAKVCLDTLCSEAATLTREQQQALYEGVSADYANLKTRKKIWEAVREDKYYNALQLKYAEAVTCHKSQGGQWDCVFIDCPFWNSERTVDDLKWLYTALTRAVKKVYLVNFSDNFFL